MRSIICEMCGQSRRTSRKFDLCEKCLRSFEKITCPGCDRSMYRAPNSIHCTRCVGKLAEKEIVCKRCGLIDYPFVRDLVHCRKCHSSTVARQEFRRSLPNTIVCVLCGATKASWKKGEQICQACDNKRRNGTQRCTAAGCDKQINNKTSQLCKRHDADRQAASTLKKYLDNYESPFPQNNRYIAELSSRIDWSNATYARRKIVEGTVCRFRAIGKFLQSYELPEVLTWDAINAALPPLTKKARSTTKLIRSSLMDLGHIHATSGKMTDWNSYLRERCVQRLAESAPAVFCGSVLAFRNWAEDGMLNPKLTIQPGRVEILSNSAKSIGDTIQTVSHLLSWCVSQNITAVSAINTEIFVEYLQSLLWQYQCSVCHVCIPFKSVVPKTCLNDQCRAAKSYLLKERISRTFLKNQLSHLRRFFDWAVLNDLLPENPADNEACKLKALPFVSGEGGATDRRIGIAIRRYAEDVIVRLCEYIFSAKADPEEALVLYLVIFHLCTVKELCGLRVPSFISAGTNTEEDFKHLVFSPQKASRGSRRPRRTRAVLKFPSRASIRLRPLLERFYEQRKQYIRTDLYEYLFAVKTRCRHNKPVSEMYVRRIVRRASLRVLEEGEVCTTRLRITAAALFSKKSKKRSGLLRPLGYRSAHAAAFNYLEEVILPLKTTRAYNDRRM